MSILTSNLHFIKGLDPVADAFAGTVYSDIVSASNFDTVSFLIYIGVGATGTSTLTVQACDDTSASNTSAVVFKYKECTSGDTWGTVTAAAATGFTTTAGSSKMVLVEVDTDTLAASGYEFVRLKAVESVDSACLGGILIIGSGVRYAQDVLATAIV